MTNSYEKRQAIINQNVRLHLSPMSKIHRNNPSINSGNTLEHEMKKCEICYHLKKTGIEFACEAILKNGLRPDIITLDTNTPVAYEIMKSESEESIIKKTKEYEGIIIVRVKI